MNILIVGASGLVGGNCLAQFQNSGKHKAFGTHYKYPTSETFYFNSSDLNDKQNEEIKLYPVDAIIHCAALTFVDYCEQNPEESYQKTVVSARNMIELAKIKKTKLVYLSTDYVFDGKSGPYTEEDKVNPVSVYGAHKLEAENEIVSSGIPYLIVRITNVYGEELRGKNFISRIIQQINNKEKIELKLPSDQFATPINAADIAKCIELLLESNKTGIYHLASTDFMNRYQLAERVVGSFGYNNSTLTPVKTLELNQIAKRPLKGGLLAVKFLQEFPNFRFSNVDDYLKNHLKG